MEIKDRGNALSPATEEQPVKTKSLPGDGIAWLGPDPGIGHASILDVPGVLTHREAIDEY